MKRITKQQKEDQQRAALLRRVTDVYSGAMGEVWDGDQFANAQLLGNVMPVLRKLFCTEGKNEWMFNYYCLHYFDTAETATEHLFKQGVRA